MHEVEHKIAVEKGAGIPIFIMSCIVVMLLLGWALYEHYNGEPKPIPFHKPHCIELSRRAKLDQEIYYQY